MNAQERATVAITGGRKLAAREVAVDGASGAALAMLAAAAATRQVVELANLPRSGDVLAITSLIEACGWSVTTSADRTRIEPSGAPAREMHAAGNVRASGWLVPALLGACGLAEMPWPGGDPIADRAMDLIFKVYEAFGDHCVKNETGYRVTAGSPPARAEISLPYPSRGATIAALARAASTASTTVVIDNPNTSAETMAVFDALSGLAWDGHWSARRLTLIPREPAAGAAHWTVPGDSAQAATLACALLVTGGSGDITGVPARAMTEFCGAVARVGYFVEPDGDRLYVRPTERSRQRRWTGIEARTGPDPRGLPAEVEPLLMALALGCAGVHTFRDEINPGRHPTLIPQLAALGADIIEHSPSEASLHGPQHLVGAPVAVRDKCGGAALMIAALAAEGTTTIIGVEHVRRGYADLPGKLAGLGAEITPTP